MITFIYGNYGSGKTTRIFEKIKKSLENKRHVFLIVPEQEAVSAERMTLEAFPPSAQLEIEILNFSRLYNRVCREYGGLSYRYVTNPIRHLLMWQNLRELAPCLEEYGELVLQANGRTGLRINQEEGFIWFAYTDTPEDQEIYYLAVCCQSEDAFWIVNFATPASNRDQYKETFLDWAETIQID